MSPSHWLRHFESFSSKYIHSLVLSSPFNDIYFSSLEPIAIFGVGSYIVSTCIHVSRPLKTPSVSRETQSSCDWGVKSVGNQTVWYFRDHSQTNHKHTGTAYNNICVMFVRRGSNYVCLNEVMKFCEGWVNQSRINQTFRVLCVVFHFFFSGLVFLLWNRLRSLGWGRISSVRAYMCLDH